MGFKSWIMAILGKPDIKIMEDHYKQLLDKCLESNVSKSSHIKTLENMLIENEKRHLDSMVNINKKLDAITKAYKAQNLELKAITKELLFQKEEALAWRERLEELMNIHKDTPGILAEVEKKRRKKGGK